MIMREEAAFRDRLSRFFLPAVVPSPSLFLSLSPVAFRLVLPFPIVICLP